MPSTEVMQKKLDAKFAVKEVNDATGEFEGFASTYSIDQSGEKIAKGAWKRTLSHNGGAVPILFGHSTMEPCGWNLSASETDHGLLVRGKLHLETEVGKKAYYFLKGAKEAGGKGGLSVGFRVIKDHWEKDEETKQQIRVYDEVQLMEYSVVVFPCQLEAYATEIKAQYDTEVEKSGKTKRVAGEDLPASSFAYVGDPEDTSTWKLPYRGFSSDEKNASHVRNALARFSQTEGIPESEKPAVLAKLRAAAKEHGIDVSDSDGKQAAEIPTTKDAIMPPTDFQAALAQQKSFSEELNAAQTRRQMYQERSDIECALWNTIEAITENKDGAGDDKKAAIRAAYAAYADAMASWFEKAVDSGLFESRSDYRYYADVNPVNGKAADVRLEMATAQDLATKGKMPAAKKVAMKHAISMHNAGIDLHYKGLKIMKDLMDGTDDDASLDDDMMGAMSGADPEQQKSEEVAVEDISAYLAELPKFSLSEAA